MSWYILIYLSAITEIYKDYSAFLKLHFCLLSAKRGAQWHISTTLPKVLSVNMNSKHMFKQPQLKPKARWGNIALIHAFYYKLAKNMTVTYCIYTNVFETINNEIHILIYEIHSTISL